MDELLTKKDLCQWLKISIPTVDRWRAEGLPFKKVGRQVRFEKSEVEYWLAKQNKK
jgi:excisionase family DNA binding protein